MMTSDILASSKEDESAVTGVKSSSHVTNTSDCQTTQQVIESEENVVQVFLEEVDPNSEADSSIVQVGQLHSPFSVKTETHGHDIVSEATQKPVNEEDDDVSEPLDDSLPVESENKSSDKTENPEEHLKSNEDSYKERCDKKLTSWECYTIVMRRLVEELIQLGAQTKLREVSFQLWASYLKQENIAFFSKTEKKYPVLPERFKNVDAEALYNVKKLRKLIVNDVMMESPARKRKRSKCNAENLGVKVKIPFQDNQRKTVVGQFLKFSESKQIKIAMKESTFNGIVEPAKEIKRQKEKHENVPSNVQWYEALYLTNPRSTFTVHTILAIIRLALCLIRDDIQLSDLFRWTCEGRWSVYRAARFLPEDAPVFKTEILPCTRKNFLKFDLLHLCQALTIDEIPAPDLFKLVERYCDELSVPNELVKFTQRLMHLFTPRMDFADYHYRVFPDYECRAMGFIIFALKLLFSLDDVTELKQSHFADTLNEKHENLSNRNVPFSFSWSSWVRYIECRKAVLCKYDVTMNKLNEADDAKTDVNVFLNYWNKNQPCFTASSGIKKDIINRLDEAAKARCIKIEDSGTANLEFPPTLSPMKTYTRHLLAHHSNLLSSRCRKILSNDFSSYSIRYLLDHKWAMEMASYAELEVQPVFDNAVAKHIPYEEPESSLPTSSLVVPAHVSTPVVISNDKDDANDRETYRQLKKFHSKFVTLKSESDEKIPSKCSELYYPSNNYWFFHAVERSTKSENFDKIAAEHLPRSFVWLLTECSKILRCELFDLYIELVTIERVYYYMFADGDVRRDDKLTIYSNEW